VKLFLDATMPLKKDVFLKQQRELESKGVVFGYMSNLG